MKTPGLRMVDLTGPFFHNGSAATLKQVVEFYDNGGNFCKPNIDNLDPDIQSLELTEAEKHALVHFLRSLTDRRVAMEKNHFDHPSLTVAKNGRKNGTVIEIQAVGKGGREPLGLAPLGRFLDVNQQNVGNAPVDAECSPNVNRL